MGSPRRLLIDLCLAVLVWMAAWSCVYSQTVWQWSPPAAHHQAVCLVRASSGNSASSGSGTYVRVGDVSGVLTARHCLQGEITIRWADGTTSAGQPTTDASGADLGFVVATHPSIQPLEISSAEPAPGEWLEFAGFGGPRDQLRHWWGRLSAVSGRDERGNPFADYACPVMQGDSGGTILNQAHQVVGVITVGGGQTIGSLGAAQAFQSTGGPAYTVVSQFAYRVAARYANTAGCGPGGCGPQRPGSGSGGWAYPPQAPPVAPPPPLVPIQPPPPTAPTVPGFCPGITYQVDYERLARCLVPLLVGDPALRGPAGPAGPPGTNGTAGVITSEQLALILNAMASDPRFRGPAGPAGPAGAAGTDGQPGTAGAATAVDLDALVAAVIPKLPPIYFRKVNSATGAEIAPPQAVRLGEGFTFVLTPAR